MVSRSPSSLTRLAPLIPQLAKAWQRNSGEVPEVLQPANKRGGRHIAVLASLQLEGPGSVSELAERLGMSPAYASLVIGELAKAGLVARDHTPADRRRIIVSLSSAAEPAVAEMRRRNVEPLEAFLAELDDEQAAVFTAHLARLVELMYED